MKTSNKAPRFFIEQKISENVELIISDEKIIHQIKNVLRKKEGEEVIFLDGKGSEFFGTISNISKNEIMIEKNKIEFYKNNIFENI
jgi:16S rRNA U1498 N3-methylase RsmE